MKILTKKDLPLHEKTAVAIGMFDGLHLGHMQLIQDIEAQSSNGCKSIVYTFNMKPKTTKLIFTNKEKESLFRTSGIDYYYPRSFDKKFSNILPEQFLDSLIADLNITHITVGFDFKFGRNAQGNTEYLKQAAKQYGFTLSIIPEVTIAGEKVSSSSIREMIEDGNMELTTRMLGKQYFIDGKTDTGIHLGSKMGFPTANFDIDPSKLLPKYGVYVTITNVDGVLHPSVTNVGVKPTVKNDTIPNVETYLLNFSGNLYGKKLRVYFIEKLRDEKRFDSIDELQKEIGHNSLQAQEKLADLDVYKPYLL